MSAFSGTVAAAQIPAGGARPNALGNALASTQSMINSAVNPTMQGPIQKTFTDSKGVIRYVGTGAKVPGEIVRQIRLRQATAARLQAQAKKDGKARRGTGGRTTPAGSGGAGNSRGTGSGSSSVDTSTNPLGKFGEPDTKNVSRIVNSIINDATNQYRWAAQDARKKAQADLMNVAEGALGYDRLGQTAAAANKTYTDNMLATSTAQQQADAAATAQYRQSLEANSQTGGTPLEYTVADADAAGAGTAAQVEGSQIGAANQAFFDMSRMANATSAQTAGRDIRSAYANELQQNQRAIAAERSKRALYEQQIRKDLMDQHIAKRMAEAEYQQRGSNLQNDQVSRQGAAAQLQAQKESAAVAKSERDWKAYEVMQSVIMGAPTQYEELGAGADGKPIKLKKTAFVGQASTWNEALRRLRLAGLGNKQYINEAKQFFDEISFNQPASALGQQIAGLGI